MLKDNGTEKIMEINEFINNFQNHPILFVGTGLSLRYLNNSYNWEGLLKEISDYISDDPNHFYDLKNRVFNTSKKEYDLPKLATIIGKELDEYSMTHTDDETIMAINKKFYEDMEDGLHSNRLKIFISLLVMDCDYRSDTAEEVKDFKRARKNIGSVITTNYDTMIEEVFGFQKLIGNNILLSNPYGSVYKIHGCITKPEEIIINNEDYREFEQKYELIRAQLLSLFIHNPIIFIGYSINDENIQNILETIFKYVDPKSAIGEQITKNFLVIEHDAGNTNTRVTDYDKTVGDILISLNKIKTDNFSLIYDSISNLNLPISVMDIRKVRNITRDIYRGGPPEDAVQVKITEDIDQLDNSDKVLALGTEKTINYIYSTTSEICTKYFSIIEENNYQILEIIDKLSIQSQQYFPVFAFSDINGNLNRTPQLKEQQLTKINEQKNKVYSEARYQKDFNSISAVLESEEPKSNRHHIIIYNLCEENIDLEDLKQYLLNSEIDKKDTDYRRLLCFYDYKMYGK